eukprot:3408918-Pyramimonas_sp.AAC.1
MSSSMEFMSSPSSSCLSLSWPVCPLRLSGWGESLERSPIRLGRWGTRRWTPQPLATYWLGQRPAQ